MPDSSSPRKPILVPQPLLWFVLRRTRSSVKIREIQSLEWRTGGSDHGLRAPGQKLLKVGDVAQRLQLGKTKVFELLAAGKLESLKIDGARRVTEQALNEFIAQLEAETKATVAGGRRRATTSHWQAPHSTSAAKPPSWTTPSNVPGRRGAPGCREGCGTAGRPRGAHSGPAASPAIPLPSCPAGARLVSDDVLDLVLGKLDGVRQQGGYWMARCPAHEDAKASLSVRQGTEQPVLLHCHAGCEVTAVLDAIGLSLADVSSPNGREQPAGEWTPGEAIAVYSYVAERGKLYFQVCRTADKQFLSALPRPGGQVGVVSGNSVMSAACPTGSRSCGQHPGQDDLRRRRRERRPRDRGGRGSGNLQPRRRREVEKASTRSRSTVPGACSSSRTRMSLAASTPPCAPVRSGAPVAG